MKEELAAVEQLQMHTNEGGSSQGQMTLMLTWGIARFHFHHRLLQLAFLNYMFRVL